MRCNTGNNSHLGKWVTAMERTPIQTNLENLAVVMVQNSTTFSDLLPDYQFQFQGREPSQEAENMYNSLVDFLHTNEEMAIMSIENKDEFTKGFKRALAMTRLWMNSLYLSEKNST